jgi:hypothetical protein
LQKIQGLNVADKLEAIEKEFLKMIDPKSFAGATGGEIQMIKGFEDTCIFLKQHNVHNDPRKMSVLSFFQAVNNLKQQAKKKNK